MFKKSKSRVHVLIFLLCSPVSNNLPCKEKTKEEESISAICMYLRSNLFIHLQRKKIILSVAHLSYFLVVTGGRPLGQWQGPPLLANQKQAGVHNSYDRVHH